MKMNVDDVNNDAVNDDDGWQDYKWVEMKSEWRLLSYDGMSK